MEDAVLLERRLQRRQRLESGARARMLVAVEGPLAELERQDFAGKPPVLDGVGGLALRGDRELVELAAAVSPLRGDHLPGEALRHEIGPLLHQTGRGGPVASDGIGPHRHPRHVLDSAGHHQLCGAAAHRLCAEIHCLQAGAAKAVHGGAWHFDGEARRQHRSPGDVHPLLAHLRHASHDHVVDVLGPHVGALQRAGQRARQQIDRVH